MKLCQLLLLLLELLALLLRLLYKLGHLRSEDFHLSGGCQHQNMMHASIFRLQTRDAQACQTTFLFLS